jgi:hypothetical protein
MSPDYYTWSRVIIEYEDGTKVATCSFHCACLELVSKFARGVTKILVGDYQTKELIDAETAVFVIGGDKHGDMAKTATWAFAKKEEAENYVKDHGGVIGNFGNALDAAYKDISDGIKNRRERDRKVKALRRTRNNAKAKTEIDAPSWFSPRSRNRCLFFRGRVHSCGKTADRRGAETDRQRQMPCMWNVYYEISRLDSHYSFQRRITRFLRRAEGHVQIRP